MNTPSDKDCLAFLEAMRWNGSPICPYCDSGRTTTMPKECRHHCNNCNTAFSVTVGTVFHRTHLSLGIWFAAVSLILDTWKPIPARRLAQQLGINKNTAWYVSKRINEAMLDSSQRDLLLEIAEIAEIYMTRKTENAQENGAIR